MGLGAGLQGFKRSVGGALEMAGSATGLESLQKYGGEVRQAADEAAKGYQPRVTKLEDIHSLGDAADYVTYAIAEAAPSIGTAVGGSLAGGALGGKVGGPIGAGIGTVVGGVGMSYLQQAGGLYADLIEQGYDAPGAAAAAGIPMALLEYVLPSRIGGKLVWRPAKEAIKEELAKRTVGKIVKKAVGEGVREGVTETAQEGIAIGTEGLVTGRMPAQAASRALNAAAAGALAGTTYGGAATAYERRQARKASAPGQELVTAPQPVAAPPVAAPVEAPAVVPVEAAPAVVEAPPTPVVPRDTSVPVPLEGIVEQTERAQQIARELEQPPAPLEYHPQPTPETFQEAQERRRGTPEPIAPAEPPPPGAPARDEQQLKSIADFAATRRAVSVASIQREFRLKFAEAQSVIQELEDRGLLLPVQKGGQTIWKRTPPPPTAAVPTDSGVNPVVVQTDTVPWAGPPPPPQATPQDLAQAMEGLLARQQALPPAPILPEIVAPSPAAVETPQVEDVPGTVAPTTLTAPPSDVQEQQTPQELQTALEQRQAEEPAVEAPSLEDTMTRYSAKHAGKEAKITVTKLGKTNQWYASVNRGGQAVESIYAGTKEEAEAALAVKMNERMDLLEQQDQNMEALLQASLKPAAPAAPLPAPGPLTLKPGDLQPNTLLSHEIGIPEFEGMQQTLMVPAGGSGVSLVIDANTALATPTEPGIVPSGAVKGLVVNTGALPSPIGVSKSRINAIAQGLGIPVHYLSSKKAVDYFVSNLKLDQDLSKIRSKQSEAGFVRLDMADMATITRELARKLQGSVKNLPFMAKGQTQDEIDRFNKFGFKSLGLIQLAERLPGHAPLQQYLESVRTYWNTKSQITGAAEKTLQAWRKLGKQQFQTLVDYAKAVDQRSFAEGRLLGDPELVQMAADRKLKKSTFEVYKLARENVQSLFDRQEQIALAHVQRKLDARLAEMQQQPVSLSVPQVGNLQMARARADVEMEAIRKEFDDLRNRNYFPQQHFGNWVVDVRAKEDMTYGGREYKAGELIERSSFEREKAQKQRETDATKEYPAGKVDIKRDLWSDSATALRGFPGFQALLDGADDINPGEAEKLAEESGARKRSEGNLIRSMKGQRGAFNYSQDVQRAFANFFADGANHVARLEHSPALEQAVDAAKALADTQATGDVTQLREVQSWMEEHRKLLHNPGNEMPWLSGFLFNYYFLLNPKQAVVNLLQVPQFAYPYLAKTYAEKAGVPAGKADAIASYELLRAGKQAWSLFEWKDKEFHIKRMDPGLTAALQRATAEGVVSDTFAMELAGLAHGNMQARTESTKADISYYAREFTRWGTSLFRISEQHNRYTTFIGSFNIARRMGMNAQEAYKFSRNAVESTMFNPASWNKPLVMQGKLAPVFAFKSFQQNALYFYGALGPGGGKGQAGRGRALGVMFALGGMLGLPWLEDGMNLISALGTWGKQFFGVKNPRVDLEEEARKLLESWHVDPHLFMNGITSESFGLHKVGALAGAPIPSVDISASLQMGRVLPGLRPALEMLVGTETPLSAGGRFLTEVSGVGGTVGMNMARALSEDSAQSNAILKVIFGQSVGNVTKAWEMAAEGKLTNNRGEKLVDFDMSSTEDQLQVLAQLLGMPPTAYTQMQARKFQDSQASRYYNARRELMYNRFAHLAGKGDGDKAGEELQAYNEQMEPQYRITMKEAVASFRSRSKNQQIREAGLPTQKRYRELYENMKKAFPVQGEP